MLVYAGSLLYHFPERGLKPFCGVEYDRPSSSLLCHFPERGLKLHLLEIFPFLCNTRLYALRRKKPGFLPNLWTTTKYFRKKTRFLVPYLASLPLPREGLISNPVASELILPRVRRRRRAYWCQLKVKPIVRQGLKPLPQSESPLKEDS